LALSGKPLSDSGVKNRRRAAVVVKPGALRRPRSCPPRLRTFWAPLCLNHRHVYHCERAALSRPFDL